MKKVYLIGSLRNSRVPEVAAKLRGFGYDVFDDWHAPGSECDVKWREYETQRGRSFVEALNGHHAKHVFGFDKYHLDQSDVCILLLPAGKSGHMELGYMLGQGKRGFVVLDEDPERWDVMYLFATGVFSNVKELYQALTGDPHLDPKIATC